MALLTPEQLAQLRQIIDDASTAVSISTVGHEVTDAELQRLVDEGWVDPDVVDDVVLTGVQYGSLLSKLPEAADMDLAQFIRRMQKNPIKLSDAERHAVRFARDRAGQYCVSLGSRYNDRAGRMVVEADAQLEQETRGIIRQEVARTVAARRTRGQLASDLGNLTEDWARDWRRIANTEVHMAQQAGYLEDVRERHGDDELLAKVPEPNACADCKRLYLDAEGQPIVRSASWWADQGASNAGRKRADWQPVLGAMHPWCQCRLIRVPGGWELKGEFPAWDLVPEGTETEKSLAKGGPYIGPRGGKWADPQHTIPWKEPAGQITWQRSKFSEGHDHAMVEVSLSRLDKLWSRDSLYLKPGDPGIKDRKAKLREHLGRGKVRLEAPEVAWTDGRVVVEDGRHRLAVLREMRAPKVAVAMPRRELAAFLEHVGGAEMKPPPRVEWRRRPGTLQKARKLHGRRTFQGFEISIENRKGSVRHWYDKATDTEGQTKMAYPYGYIRLTEGMDGDHVDVFLGPDETAPKVYVVHQMRAPDFKVFDEDKVMMGFPSARAAKAAYLQHFDSPKFFGGMSTMPVEEFRKKVHARKRKMIKAQATRRPNGQYELPFAKAAVDYQPRVTAPVGTMGHHSPARTAGANVRDDKQRVRADWPPLQDGPRPNKVRKRKPAAEATDPELAGVDLDHLVAAAERFDVRGLRQGYDWANTPKLDRVEELQEPEERTEAGQQNLETIQEIGRQRRKTAAGARLTLSPKLIRREQKR